MNCLLTLEKNQRGKTDEERFCYYFKRVYYDYYDSYGLGTKV